MATCYKDLTLYLFIIIVLIIIINGDFKRLVIRKYNPIFFIIAPLLFFILTTLLLHDPETLPFFSWKIKNFFIILLPTVVLSFTCVKNDKDWQCLGTGIIALSLYTSFYIFINSIYTNWGYISYLMSSTIASLGGILSFSRLISKNHKQRILNLAFFIVSTVGVLVSYGRGQQIVYIVVLFILYIKNILSTASGIRAKLFLFFLPLILGLFCYSGYYYKMQQGENIFIRYSGQHFTQGMNARLSMINQAVEFFETRPIIPSGIGSFTAEAEKGIYKYPHNIPLELMAEIGIWGGLWYVFILCCAVAGYLRCRRSLNAGYHFYIYLYLLFISFKQGTVFTDKAFWVWTALGIGLLGAKLSPIRA